ncbi:MAG TPA: hypothetical protein ENG46_01415 [Acidilobales archaeon]|nr:hypothetical protein [Acidilobales archaeon]
MAKWEDVIKWGLIAVVVYFGISFLREIGYGLAYGLSQLPELFKALIPKVKSPAELRLTVRQVLETVTPKELKPAIEEHYLKSGLPPKTVKAIEEYTKGEPEGLKRYWLIQARRYYHYEQLLKGRKPTVEEALMSLMRVRTAKGWIRLV